MTRRNYKVSADVGLTRRHMYRCTTILDTKDGSSDIRRSSLFNRLTSWIKPVRSSIVFKDASNKRINLDETIVLVVRLGTRVQTVKFYVVDRLSTDIILRCDLCDKHFDAIWPRRSLVEIYDDTTIPIIRKPSERKDRSFHLPEEQ